MNRRSFFKRAGAFVAGVCGLGAKPNKICRPKSGPPGPTMESSAESKQHRKIYRGGECILMCGNRQMYVGSVKMDVNWVVESCPYCGMYVSTHGYYPKSYVYETKDIEEATGK